MGHVLTASRVSQLSSEPFARVHPPHPIAELLSSPPFLFPSRGQKLLGKLCEQNKVLREQERLVQQLRAEKVRGGQLKQPSGDEPGCTAMAVPRQHLRGEEATCHSLLGTAQRGHF